MQREGREGRREQRKQRKRREEREVERVQEERRDSCCMPIHPLFVHTHACGTCTCTHEHAHTTRHHPPVALAPNPLLGRVITVFTLMGLRWQIYEASGPSHDAAECDRTEAMRNRQSDHHPCSMLSRMMVPRICTSYFKTLMKVEGRKR